MTKFNVVINPFSYKVLIWARIDKINQDVVIEYNNQDYLDWWGGFEMGDKTYLLHIYYETELEVAIYDEVTDSIGAPYPLTFKIIHKDEF